MHPSGEAVEWVEDGEPAVIAPEELVENCDKLARAVRRELGEDQPVGFSGFQGTSRYGSAALASETAIVSCAVNGTRNDTLNGSSFALGRLVGGGELEADEAVSSLEGAARLCGLSETESRRTIESGFTAGLKHPRQRGAVTIPSGLAPPAGAGGAALRVDEPVLLRMADVEPESVRWLWPDRIPRGRLTLLAGMPGQGKSFATCDIAARISTGSAWPDGAPCEQGSVLFVAAEDDPADTVRPRLDAHGADVRRVHLLSGVRRHHNGKPVDAAFTLEDLAPLERALEDLRDVRLVVIDPIGSYMGTGANADKDTEVRAVLAPLAALASRSDAAVLIVAHTRKAQASHADDAVMGSRAFTGIARSVLHLMPDPDDPSRRLLLPGKSNLSAASGGLAFTIGGEPARVRWSDVPVTMTAADVLASGSGGSDGGAFNDACEWLRDVLCGGPVPSAELRRLAKEDGLAWRTVERAKPSVGVQSGRIEYDDDKPWACWLGTGQDAGGENSANSANSARV